MAARDFSLDVPAAGTPAGSVSLEASETLREYMREHALCPESEAVARLIHDLDLTGGAQHRAVTTATALVEGARQRRAERPLLETFLQEFGLSNQEGIALMCIAEALLRIPDNATADRLIAEQLTSCNWSAHLGHSESLFVNASTWALTLTGRWLDLDPAVKSNARGWLQSLAHKIGDAVVRVALRRAMLILGGEFVVASSIEAALARSATEPALALCSFDMLGEGARTLKDAAGYLASYHEAIEAIGAANAARVKETGASVASHVVSGVSVKLSALEPRYSLLQRELVWQRLIPKGLELAQHAARAGIQLTLDAEEADRLELLLDVFEALACDATTGQWPGLGLAVQAYDKRACSVCAWAASIARREGRRVTVRLVKGAYWDTEIKRGQERGLESYPVFTRKLSTDVSYLACAGTLFKHTDVIYPQFATHNAYSISAIVEMAPPGAAYEFQRLHGMGALLYAQAARQIAHFPQVRVYAPVGEQQNLFAYLVQRLLENGATGSFMNRCMDPRVPAADIVQDPLAALTGVEAAAHPLLPSPPALYRHRSNAQGVDLGNPRVLKELRGELEAMRGKTHRAAPLINGKLRTRWQHPVTNPADRREVVGHSQDATQDDIVSAFDVSSHAQPDWNQAGGAARADVLERAADLLELRRTAFYSLLVREAGKTLPEAIAEVRECADFCRYHAARAREQFCTPRRLAGPTGEINELSLGGRGVFACISPWSSPLAIFAGQVSAALAAGNSVVAKPAEATPLIASAFVALLHEAGVPTAVLQVVPCPGPLFGQVALAHGTLAGVAFTGSPLAARSINRQLAERNGAILPLIAETGGLNAMIVDSSAVLEHVVDDTLTSAFRSAGQCYSALRLLFLQDSIADKAIEMLVGAMDELIIGNPAEMQTDVGPVISADAVRDLTFHVESLRSTSTYVASCRMSERHAHGSFFPPHLIELQGPEKLTCEAFGPILHVVRYRARDIDQVLQFIRRSGYGLTLGVQSRLEGRWRKVFNETLTGNAYINRSMLGGGPHYLTRYANERTLTVNTTATGGNTALLNLDG